MRKPKSVSLPEELWARIDSERGMVSRSRYVEETVKRALNAHDVSMLDAVPEIATQTGMPRSEVRRRIAMDEPLTDTPPQGYRCADRECDWTAPSEKARCPRHPGRTVPL